MIELLGLTKIFYGKSGEKKAVNDLSFKVRAGEIFGLLGTNGAGKTTTLKMLTLALKPTCGKIFVEGKDIYSNSDEYKRRIGVCPQHINFDTELTARENLYLHGRLYRMGDDEIAKKIGEILEYMELEAFATRFTKNLSGGEKRRLIIGRALMHSPKILFLDEPTVALDPKVRRRVWELLKNLKSEGVTIFLTTHYIEEAEILADRVAILDRGNLIALEKPQTLTENLGKYAVEWEEGVKFFTERKAARDFFNGLNAFDARIRKTKLEDAFLKLTDNNGEV